jgi:uracil-DNA glycosylase family 4
MNSLKDLYEITYDGCKGCSILGKNLPMHSIMDYKELHESEILMVSDSFKMQSDGGVAPFTDDDIDLILDVFGSCGFGKILDKVQFTAAVKCPRVKIDDMSKQDKDICRKHLEATIDKVKPRIVFGCGNLPLVMLTKKTGIEQKRGRSMPLKTELGHEYTLIPIYHPYQVLVEPKNRYLFQTDIENAINEFVLKKVNTSGFSYTLVDSISKLKSIPFPLDSGFIAIDTETTGLNFLTDKLLTIALTFKSNGKYQNYVIPFHHKETPFNDADRAEIVSFMSKVFASPVRKILHNAKFDLKFFKRAGVGEMVNVWDTKIMQHLVDENLPKSLKDLVNYYFPHELAS